MATRPVVNHVQSAIGADGGIMLGNSVWIFGNSGVPTDGTSGTGAGFAGPGSLCINYTSAVGTLYQNTNTKASPTWTAR